MAMVVFIQDCVNISWCFSTEYLLGLFIVVTNQWTWMHVSLATRTSHTWYRMQGMKNVGRDPRRCRSDTEYRQHLVPFLIPS